MIRGMIRLVLSLLLVAPLSLWLVQNVRAAGVVGTGTAASCSEAAFEAALTGGGTVSFNCGGAATIVLTSTKQIIADTIIDGAGLITLSGNDTTRLFFVNGIGLTLNNITLTNGASAVGGGAIESVGGHVVLNNSTISASKAVGQGGAIYCFVGTGGRLTINTSTISGNSAARGGGVYNDGCLLTISNSQFSGNSTVGEGTKQGGAIYTDGQLRVSGSAFSGNQGFDGGAIYVSANADALLDSTTIISNSGSYGGGIENSGMLTVTNSLLQGNSVTGSGGGIWNLNGSLAISQTSVVSNTAFEGGGVNSYGNSVQLRNVNIVGNTANGENSGGGGIYHSAGTFFVTNATISGNRATAASGDGGGVYQNSDDNLTLTSVTLSENSAARFGGGFYHVARFAVLTNVTIGRNTALAGNEIYEAAIVSPAAPGILQIGNSVVFGSANNCGGSEIGSLGNNIRAGSCGGIAHATDQQVADARMGPLALNGGAFRMRTILPQSDSPAIGAANPGACPGSDQRGASRVANCDAGAVEFGATAPTPVPEPTTPTTPTTTSTTTPTTPTAISTPATPTTATPTTPVTAPTTRKSLFVPLVQR